MTPDPTFLLAQAAGLLELELAVTMAALVFTFAGPLVAVPGETMRDNHLTGRGWFVIGVTGLALLAQATHEYLQQSEDQARAAAVDQGFARLESKLEVMLAAASGGPSASETGPVSAKGFDLLGAEPAKPGPAFGFPSPAPLPTELQSELDALREVAGR